MSALQSLGKPPESRFAGAGDEEMSSMRGRGANGVEATEDEVKKEIKFSPFIDAVKEFAPQGSVRSLVRRIFFPRSHVELQFAVDARTAENNGLKRDDIYNKVDWFEAVSLVAILFNAVVLANADPMQPNSVQNQLINYVDTLMTFFFTGELLLRVVCFGVAIFEAEAWFVADLVVVGAGLLSWVLSFVASGQSSSLSALRAIRLLRPLRTIRVISSVRVFLAAMINALFELTDIFVLLLIFIRK